MAFQRSKTFFASVFFCFVVCYGLCLNFARADDLKTIAERSDFSETSTSAQSLEFLDRCAADTEWITRIDIGKTLEGRPLACAVVADPPVKSFEQLDNDSRLVVLAIGNIHSGECAGKEALLAMLRDQSRGKSKWLKNTVLVFLPNYNADANDRRGPSHRPGQVGPRVMGIRENAQQLDLNRDFMKLDAPESRALVSLIDQLNPHVFIDCHTTNGSQHRYHLTYDIPRNPAVRADIRHYLRQKMMPEITTKLGDQTPTFFYGNFDRQHKRWTTFGQQPRYSTEYVGLRGRLAILSEAYSYVSYKKRIKATEAFVSACIEFAFGHEEEIKSLLAASSELESLPIRSKLTKLPEKVVVRGYDGENRSEKAEQKKPKDYSVDHYAVYEGTHSIEVPDAYVIPYDMSRYVDRLLMHGIQVQRLTETREVQGNLRTVKQLKRATTSFQGHNMLTLDTEIESTQFHAKKGDYVVLTKQPLGRLAAYLLEPESDDGLATWGFLGHAAQKGKVLPVLALPKADKLSLQAIHQVTPASQLTLDQIYGPRGRVNYGGSFSLSLRWLDEKASYEQTWNRRAMKVDAETGAMERQPRSNETAAIAKALESVPFLDPKQATSVAARRVATSKQGRLLRHADDLIYYDTEAKSARRLTAAAGTEEMPAFSPNGKYVAFVRDYNLYVVDVATGAESQLTTEGKRGLLFGKLDWVYQEELYGRGNFKGFWWSPNSQRIAFLRIDESKVHKYTVSDNIPYRQELEVTHYPKAGDPLPSARLGVVTISGNGPTWVDDYQYSLADFLISRVGWNPDGQRVVYQVQDRAQTWLDFCSADPRNGKATRWFRESTGGWVNTPGDPTWLKDGSFLWLSERDGFNHLYHYSGQGKLLKQLTDGNWEIRSLIGVSPDQKQVYLLAQKDDSIASHGYRLTRSDGSLKKITQDKGNHSIRFNDDYTHFFDYCSEVDKPVQVKLYRSDGTYVRTLSPNLDDRLRYLAKQSPQRVAVRARDGHTLDAFLIKPHDFDPKKKYPVLIYVYSGPQAPVVRDRWSGSTYLWHQMLAQKGYCIWMCDNRSASYRGAKYAWSSHRDLGTNELKDIEDGVQWLKEKPWVDGSRIGIWGWSYGGYMTSFALTHSKLFKAGIAGAPVTDWRNYDAVYTERYMGLPQDNAKGYRDSSVVAAAKNLHGRLLLIHGTKDDNVHISNTLQLALELQKSGKDFDMMIYPKNRHGISQPGQSRHLRDLMTKFILEHL